MLVFVVRPDVSPIGKSQERRKRTAPCQLVSVKAASQIAAVATVH